MNAHRASALYAEGEDFALYRGDCRTIMENMEANSFDMIFADCPYFLSNGGTTCKSGKRASVDKGDWDRSQSIESDHQFHYEWLDGCLDLLKPNGSIWVSGTQHVIFSVGYAMQRLGMKLLNTITWFKPNAAPNLACRFFTHSTEQIVWAAPYSKRGLRHTFNYAEMKTENGGKQMRDLWTFTPPKPAEKIHGKHPTQKPLALLDRIIRASTNRGDKVLDPFCGSGTTGVVATRLGRNFVGIDIDTTYLRLAEKRIVESRRDLPSHPVPPPSRRVQPA